MKFVFTDKKVNLPNKVHAYAEKKVGKLDRYFKADAEAAIVFSVEKDRNNVELTVRSGSTIIRVSEYLRHVCYHRRGGLLGRAPASQE